MSYRLNRDIEYALMALHYMNLQKKSPISAKKMAEDLSCPFDPLSHVLQKMKREGLLSSTQGVSGGYQLKLSPKQITFYDIFSCVSSPVEIADCLRDSCDMEKTCQIKEPIKLLNDKFLKFYRTFPISEILEPKKRKKL